MPALIRVRNRKAILRNGVWQCALPELESLLNMATDRWIKQTGGPSLADPDPERTVARQMILEFGGRVVAHVPSRTSASRESFFQRRQLELELDIR